MRRENWRAYLNKKDFPYTYASICRTVCGMELHVFILGKFMLEGWDNAFIHSFPRCQRFAMQRLLSSIPWLYGFSLRVFKRLVFRVGWDEDKELETLDQVRQRDSLAHEHFQDDKFLLSWKYDSIWRSTAEVNSHIFKLPKGSDECRSDTPVPWYGLLL